MTEQGAAADNAVRDGAPGGAGALRRGPRAPGPLHTLKTSGPGILARGQPIARLAWRRFALSAGASRRSISFFKGKGKQGDGRSRASEKQNPGTAKRWLFGSASTPEGVRPR